MLWVLLITLYVGFDSHHIERVELAPTRYYEDVVECATLGSVIAQMYQQDGVSVEWKCIAIEK